MSPFEAALASACKSQLLPGAVVFSTNRSGSFRYHEAFGLHTLRSGTSSGALYTTNTPMRIFSCTKLLTSIAVLQLHERSLLSLDSDIRSLVPALTDVQVLTSFNDDAKVPTFEPAEGPLTLRHLLTHSGGTFGWHEGHLMAYRKHTGTYAMLWGGSTVAERYGGPLAFQPGSAWSYGGGHDWAGQIVETISGMPLDEYFREHIVRPLGADSLTFWPRDKSMMAHCVDRDEATGKVIQTPDGKWPPYTMSEAAGGGGCTGTVEDYGKVLASLLRDDGKLLESGTLEMMFSSQLSQRAKKSLNDQSRIGGKFRNAGPGYYPDGVVLDWGLGAQLSNGGNSADERLADGGVDEELKQAEWRGKGVLTWGGWPNLSWFVDREKGICGIWGTQVLPTGDNEIRKWTVRWEKEMYERAGLL